ncbi:hypothetical protein [Microscilla marina]|uniref:Uncharacterized protein n=1 Tax=Microscilla marina ATCC 23134 TaxID=313606 RepID=A1ZV93_MICM2|nr:hypothetical protein [Microscilla marina]EAY25749.1 hypothetical protein M23134_04923 [Microscilla marina ATCC 23134]
MENFINRIIWFWQNNKDFFLPLFYSFLLALCRKTLGDTSQYLAYSSILLVAVFLLGASFQNNLRK